MQDPEDIKLSVQEFDTEVESEDLDSIDLMEKPFNPTEIDITTKPLTIDLLIKRLKADPVEINLAPAFQRKGDLWNEKKQSQLIESLLIKFPLPAFYFDGTDNNEWLVVDGLQRLSALRNFVVEKTLKLTGLEFLNKLEGYGFDDLPRNLQRQIEEAQITAYIINAGTPDEVKFNIFKRINTGGLTLNSQEIRHALNQGIPAKFVEELAKLEEFRQATGKINSERMLDREFITRFLAFTIKPISEYRPDLDTFMNEKMAEIKSLSNIERESIKTNFISSMRLAKEIFGEFAFRKVFNSHDRRRPINKALFEVWSAELSRLSEESRNKLKANGDFLFNSFIKIMKDDVFIASITSATGDKTRVSYRYSKIQSIINETLLL
ncbi:DUF262 domain-containing protein [Elizabethkingia anophelis]|uniref:DUF262 domain-containing protein n=1 Tax=Elizabethkingia anophelis TaxID=1117645 RepID=UPI0020116403|nr:DUF262 domain-containing protein [Elizabethkingia anophelis]EJC8060249.1 DUF262 domain-containing protein [Elizabethkingia anophelis]MCL1643070.1 DUF262 domain-containing protein [Elizabethkingia anophelis]MCL1643751.1 DUF262 domain-containing protein [Elizabethkingia anophelis]MCT4032848.1 DUF262 domain-containing protein [Elizabethkingia anophelis]MDV3781446.1 hypothetical protein [Elizabethkingia anophelis]